MERQRTNLFFRMMLLAILFFAFTPQSTYAVSGGKFKSVAKKGRALGEPYSFRVDFIDKVLYDSSSKKLREKAMKNGYYVLELEEASYNGREYIVKFIENDQRSILELEKEFKMLLYGNKNYYTEDLWTNKSLRGGDFKSKGTVFVYIGSELKMFQNALWTGEVTNGMINGAGDGCLSYKEGDYWKYISFSGIFKSGKPIGDLNTAVAEGGRGSFGGVVYDATIYKLRTGSTADGLTSFSINDKYGFMDSKGIAIKPIFNEVSDFSNGKAKVKFDGFWIIINKEGKCVEFLPGQVARKSLGGFFTNDIFSELKKLEIPKCGVLNLHACKNMKSLEEVTFVEGTYRVGIDSFEGCKKLKKVVFPNSVEEVEIKAFRDCDNLTTIIVPSSLLLRDAFLECPNAKVYIRNKDNTVKEKVNWFAEAKSYYERQAVEAEEFNENLRLFLNAGSSSPSSSTSSSSSSSSSSSDGNSVSIPNIKEVERGSHGRKLDSDTDFTDDDTYVFDDGVSIKVYHRYREGGGHSSFLSLGNSLNYYYPSNLTKEKYKTAEDAARAGWVWKKKKLIRKIGTID